jgi:hypothetical protein
VSRWVVRGRHRVRALTNDLAVTHNDSRKRAASARIDVRYRQLDCAAQKLRIWFGENRQLALSLPKRRK